MDKVAFRRRNYFVKKGLQLKLTASIVITLLVVMLITGVAVYMGMWSSIIENFSSFKVSQNLENARRMADYEKARYGKGDFRLEKIFREAELLSVQERTALRAGLKSVNKSLVPKLAILVVLIFLGGIFFSHKIAGPLYRFEKSAKAIKEGDLRASFNIRKTDELQETARVLNDMARSLRLDFERVKSGVDKLKEELSVARAGLDREKEDKLRKIIAEIDATLLRYRV